MGTTWDERFAGEDYYYGTEPNVHIAAELAKLGPGRGLFLGEGEGRNAVFAAGLGHDVVAVDSSEQGRRKALALARQHGVSIEYLIEDVVEDRWAEQPFDFAVLCFLHLPPEHRAKLHRRVVAALRTDGCLILESFAKAQLGRNSGGPPRLELLHDLAELREDFAGLQLEQAVELEVELHEGQGHFGLAVVNRVVGIKA